MHMLCFITTNLLCVHTSKQLPVDRLNIVSCEVFVDLVKVVKIIECRTAVFFDIF